MKNISKILEELDNSNTIKGDILDNKGLYLIKKIDTRFFDLLVSLYKPFISTAYKRAHIQYTIFLKRYKYPIGIIALIKTKYGGNFVELILIPQMKNKSYGFQIIKLFLKKHKLEKIGWTSDKSNFPSIKLLQKLKGGFFERTVNDKNRIQAEGFFKPNNKVLESMRNALIKLLPESELKYKIWLKEYNLRIKELNCLKKFLKEYK